MNGKKIVHSNWTLKCKERKVNEEKFRMKEWSEQMVKFLGLGAWLNLRHKLQIWFNLLPDHKLDQVMKEDCAKGRTLLYLWHVNYFSIVVCFRKMTWWKWDIDCRRVKIKQKEMKLKGQLIYNYIITDLRIIFHIYVLFLDIFVICTQLFIICIKFNYV